MNKLRQLMLPLLAGIILAGCATASKPLERHAWITGLKPEKADDYRRLHAHP